MISRERRRAALTSIAVVGALMLSHVASATASADPSDPPLVPGPVVTQGDLAVGGTVEAFGVNWGQQITFSFQWRSNGVDVPGATSQDYVVQPSDPPSSNAPYTFVIEEFAPEQASFANSSMTNV